jgi:hypothetical protein
VTLTVFCEDTPLYIPRCESYILLSGPIQDHQTVNGPTNDNYFHHGFRHCVISTIVSTQADKIKQLEEVAKIVMGMPSVQFSKMGEAHAFILLHLPCTLPVHPIMNINQGEGKAGRNFVHMFDLCIFAHPHLH